MTGAFLESATLQRDEGTLYLQQSKGGLRGLAEQFFFWNASPKKVVLEVHVRVELGWKPSALDVCVSF